ncbi:hypothetical protein CC80DRAFT_597820 [Byssothecium circinans]|uniref:Uncharacterized protein n=1 Tax=Byssothecium circinans TaxID=147558 RepID=A0A6A5TEB0_9PLEO|nr:hypothetical protein CC80DRAFT_597820 [Byssothecium circinans]
MRTDGPFWKGLKEGAESWEEKRKRLRESLKTRQESYQLEYQNNHVGLSHRNLGDDLNSYDEEVFAHLSATPYSIVRHATAKIKNEMLQLMIQTLQISDEPFIVERKLNEPDKLGIPLLHKAVEQGRIDCAALLVAHGADPSIPSRSHGTARDFLSRNKSLSPRQAREMRDLLDLQTVIALDPEESILACSSPYNRMAGSRWVYFTPEELLQDRSSRERLFGDWRSSDWVHVLSTNGLILLVIFRAIQRWPDAWSSVRSPKSESSVNSSESEWSPKLPDVVDFFYNSFRPPSVAPGDPYLNYRETLHYPNNSGRQATLKCTAIVFPFLALSTETLHNNKRKEYRRMRETLSTSTPVEYSEDCTIHFTRSLDEAYYPGLDALDLETRNRDQVVSSYLKTSRGEGAKSKPIIVVPQLWLWRIGNNIVSACSMTQESSVFHRREYYTGVNQKELIWKPLRKTHNADLQCGLIIAGFIENFGRGSTVEGIDFPPALSMFETCLVSVLLDVTRYMENRKPESISYSREKSFIHKLSDIQSELAMIKDVLEQQKEVLDALFHDRSELNEDDAESQEEMVQDDWAEVERARITLEKYGRRVDKISSDTERIDKEIQDMLNLKRTYASVKDAHASVLISTAVIGFTVVTIIFAPLAFLTALFALKIEGFENLRVDKTSEIYKSGYLGGIFVGSEILTIALTCTAVAVSLWYLKHWDTADEKANGGGTSQRDENSAKSDQESPGGSAAKSKDDIESQRSKRPAWRFFHRKA